jgi:tRNA-Thr(GGU) m(6)t(6)A37 methyltransferase TsaA
MSERMTIEAIGYIITPYKALSECPRNIEPQGPLCELVIKEDLQAGMMGLRVGQRILVLYWLGQADRDTLQQHSRRTGELAGIFALRTPNRRNPIGAAVVPIERIDAGIISVRGLDCLDGTPLLDIKPALASE